jgi:hypothetical protein
MFDTAFSGARGMFGGLRRGYQAGNRALHPYSNRLMLAGLGMLGGGPGDAMKGLVAGSALDTEDADRRKLREALAGLTESGSDLIPNDPAVRELMATDSGFAKDVLLQGMKPTDYGEKANGYLRAKAEGYTGDWMQYQADTKAAGVTVNTGQIPAEMGSRIGLGNQFLYELNVEGLSGKPPLRERIKSTFGGDTASQAKARAELAAGIGEAADIWRRVESGKEALVRNLTGAGMSMSEAQAQASRYSIGAAESVTTMLQKMDGLEADLKATRQGAIDARSGEMSRGDGEGDSAGGGNLTRDADGNLVWSP